MLSTSSVVENATSTNGASTPTAAMPNSRVQALQPVGQHADERIAHADEHDDERRGAFAERQRCRDDRQQIEIDERAVHAAGGHEHGGQEREHHEDFDRELQMGVLRERPRVAEQQHEPREAEQDAEHGNAARERPGSR